MICRPATGADIDAVCADIWQRGIDELAAFGVTVEDYRRVSLDQAAHGMCWAFSDDRGPVALLGLDLIGDGVAETTFQATSRFAGRVGRRATDAMIEFARTGHGKVLGVRRYVIRSRSNRPGVGKWFKYLGCRESNEGGIYILEV